MHVLTVGIPEVSLCRSFAIAEEHSFTILVDVADLACWPCVLSWRRRLVIWNDLALMHPVLCQNTTDEFSHVELRRVLPDRHLCAPFLGGAPVALRWQSEQRLSKEASRFDAPHSLHVRLILLSFHFQRFRALYLGEQRLSFLFPNLWKTADRVLEQLEVRG